MKKVMISQPVADKTFEEITTTRNKVVKVLEEKGYEVVNPLFTDELYSVNQMKARGVIQIPLYFLAKFIESMSCCHTVYFCKGWEKAMDCRMKHAVAVTHGLEIIYEEKEINHGNE